MGRTREAARVVHGSRVFLGGNFTNVGGAARSRLAAVDASSGIASAWDPNISLTVIAFGMNDSALFVGGSFQLVGGLLQQNFAAFEP